MVRRNAIQRIGGFREHFRQATYCLNAWSVPQDARADVEARLTLGGYVCGSVVEPAACRLERGRFRHGCGCLRWYQLRGAQDIRTFRIVSRIVLVRQWAPAPAFCVATKSSTQLKSAKCEGFSTKSLTSLAFLHRVPAFESSVVF